MANTPTASACLILHATGRTLACTLANCSQRVTYPAESDCGRYQHRLQARMFFAPALREAAQAIAPDETLISKRDYALLVSSRRVKQSNRLDLNQVSRSIRSYAACFDATGTISGVGRACC